MERKMLTGEQRIEAMHRRALEIERHQRVVRARIAGAASVCVSMLLIVVAAFNIPLIAGKATGDEGVDYTGSLFSNSPVLGLIVIGILAFVLGILVTILCFYMRSWAKEASLEDVN